MYLVTAGEMQEMDRLTITSFGIPGRVLMENAGRGAVRFFSTLMPEIGKQRVGIVAGRGNNGGDGFVIARYLASRNGRPTVYLLSPKDRVGGDAAANLALLDAMDIPVIEMPDEKAFHRHLSDMRHVTVWIDAILGTGLNSDVRGYFRQVIDFLNETERPIFAVDIASGLSSETGRCCGVCVRATATATFAHAKVGHALYPGASCTGALDVVDIGIPPHITDAVGPKQRMILPEQVAGWLPKRSPDAHKGNMGHLLVLAGSRGKTGAAVMTAMSALRAGAGLVTAGVPAALNSILEVGMTEAMTAPLGDLENSFLTARDLDAVLSLMDGKQCVALGPGIGTDDGTVGLVQGLVETSRLPLVIDADGINCLAKIPGCLDRVRCPVILTPHPGEMARLTGATVGEIQNDRIGAARSFSRQYGVSVVLKGARTVIAHSDGSVWVNPTGNSGMAAAGMGDVLTGVIAGLIAQGLAPDRAATVGVYVHGAAADRIADSGLNRGYLASEVSDMIPATLTDLGDADERSA